MKVWFITTLKRNYKKLQYRKNIRRSNQLWSSFLHTILLNTFRFLLKRLPSILLQTSIKQFRKFAEYNSGLMKLLRGTQTIAIKLSNLCLRFKHFTAELGALKAAYKKERKQTATQQIKSVSMIRVINLCIFSFSFDSALCAVASLFSGTRQCPEQMVNFCLTHCITTAQQDVFDVLYAMKQYQAAI